jgi:hypothetical protein
MKDDKMLANINNVQINEGITIHGYSDAHAYTIVSKTAKTITVQADDSTLDNWKPAIIPGGFAGHCINQNEQKYTYKCNTENPKETLHADRQGNFHAWKEKRPNVTLGRNEFYDYNF